MSLNNRFIKLIEMNLLGLIQKGLITGTKGMEVLDESFKIKEEDLEQAIFESEMRDLAREFTNYKLMNSPKPTWIKK